MENLEMIADTILKARQRAGKINHWLTALLAFFLPLSTSAITVLALLVLLFWVFEGNFSKKFATIKRNPVALSVLGLLAVLVVGLSWSPDVPAGLDVIAARWKLAMLPVFLTAVDMSNRKRYIYFFVAGVCVAMTMTYLAWFDLLHYADVTSTHLTKRNSHIVYNPLLALGIYFVLHEAIWGGFDRRKQVGFYVLASVMTFNMFITEGRIGQLAFFILLVVLLFQIFSKNRMKAVLAVSIVLPSLFMGGYTLSPAFKSRVDKAFVEVHEFKTNPDTSVGLRLLFWQNTFAIIKRHPVLGIGTGGFAIAYYWHNWELSPWHIATDNPHNQYLLVTATIGIPGLTALLLIFAIMFAQAYKMDDRYQRIRFAFPLFFLTIMLTESYLKVYETAFLFSLFSAVLYAEAPNNTSDKSLNSRVV